MSHHNEQGSNFKFSTKMDTDPLDASEIASFPPANAWAPAGLAWSPDDTSLTFLQSPTGALHRSLYSMKVSNENPMGEISCVLSATSAQQPLSREEELRRQRVRERGKGVTQYWWVSGDRPGILIPYNGQVLFRPHDTIGHPHATCIPVVHDGLAISPVASPDGHTLAFVRGYEVHITAIPAAVSPVPGPIFQLTDGATQDEGITNGLAEYIAQEELDRAEGFWWSPDSQHIAYVQVDNRHLRQYRIMHQGKDTVGPAAEEDHMYPFAGEPNAYVRLGVVRATIPTDDAGSAPSPSTLWLDLGIERDIYLARVSWADDTHVLAQILNREQTQLDLYSFDITNGDKKLLVRTQSKVWINVNDNLHQLKDGSKQFVWTSEETGFCHIRLHNQDGTVVKQVTDGAWQVDRIDSVDSKNRVVYFTGTRDSPLERHLYVVSLDNPDAQPKRLTLSPGTHHVAINHSHTMFVDSHSSLDRPPWVTVRSCATGSILGTLHDMPMEEITHLRLKPPQMVTIPAEDGTELHGALYIPDGEGPHPTVVSVYGGPHAQRVTHSWAMTVSMRAQYYRSKGLLVFVLDNRGSSRRGLEFEGALKWDMGSVEVRDQVTGVQYLIDRGLTDPSRIGVYGWSYGGYMSILLLSHPLFRVAIAGAPVTHWDGYDTCYTERYMGTPQTNPDGYARSSCMSRVQSLEGKLLLVHGLIDENVHFRHTARYINTLIEAGKDYDLLLFPNERHMPVRAADRTYMEKRMAKYLFSELLR